MPGPPSCGLHLSWRGGQALRPGRYADLAILDLGLLRDAFEERAPSRRLLRYYLNAGKPVIILGTDKGRRRPYREEGLVLLKSRPSRRTFIDAVRRLHEETA